MEFSRNNLTEGGAETSIEARNQKIRSDLGAGMLPVLPFERIVIARQIAKVKEEQDEMGRELGEVNHQGSETWHDNFAANNIQRNSVVVSRRGSKLAETEVNTVEYDYPPHGEEITVGSFLEIRFRDAADTMQVILTGFAKDPGESADLLPVPAGVTFVTLKSPLGTALLGAKPGEAVSYAVNGRPMEVQVLSVSQLQPTQ
ncbi:GreA/GreB family elongation factor [Candidatus Saccharibacteria bacterium]|nr:GreA/GreB family elongation factor [Candidatus Saccharibacteria bacterium]